MIDPELGRDLLQLNGLALVGETGVAPDHEQAADLRQIGDDVLGDPVGKELLPRVVTHIVERKHRDRRFVGLGHRRLGSVPGLARPRSDDDVEHPHREADVLQFLLASVFVGKVELVADILAHRARYRDAAGLGDALDPRRDIDPVAENVGTLDDHVAQVDSDPQLDAAILGHCGVAVAHVALDIDRAIDRADHAGEFDQHAIAGQLDDPPLMLGDTRIDHFGAMLLQRGQRPDLIAAHQAAVTNHVSSHDR